MGLYNFQPRFVPRIEIGLFHPDDPRAKTHTIRAPRKGGREDKPGNPMHLYCGLRQKGAYRIEARAGDPPPVCTRVESIVLRCPPDIAWPSARDVEVYIGEFLDNVLDDKERQSRAIRKPEKHGLEMIDEDESEKLAERDGFESFTDMMAYWSGRLPFYGHIFHWRPTTAASARNPRAASRRFEILMGGPASSPFPRD